MKKLAALGIALVGLTGLLAGCASDTSRDSKHATGDTARSSRDAGAVQISPDNRFQPQELTIRAGESVTWTNSSKDVHTVTCDRDRAKMKDDVSYPTGAKAFHSGDLQPGQTWRHTFKEPGVYRYVCVNHENEGMKGTILVKAADGKVESR